MAGILYLIFIVMTAAHQISCIRITHRITLNPVDDTHEGDTGRLVIHWGSNDTHVEVKLVYPTLGWLAMGLSPDGGMDQSDVLFAYVDDITNEVVVQDRFLMVDATAMEVSFTIDEHQNWQMISGSKNGTHTTIRAVREIDTGDAMDRTFQTYPIPIIYAYNFKTPHSPTARIKKHNVRGSTAVTFLRTWQQPTMKPVMMADQENMMKLDIADILPYSVMLSPFDHRDSTPKWLEIRWNFNDTHVDVMLCYPSLGWIAMGLSPNGGMDHSDILFAYVDEVTQEVVIQDRFLTADIRTMKINLSLDEQQDWHMISGMKNGTHTMIRAARKITTCDSMDRAFLNISSPVIFAYNFEVPKSKKHKIRMHNVRGTTSINFLNPQLQETMLKSLEEVTMNISLIMPNVEINGVKETEYFCILAEIPKLTVKHQVIATQPVINKANSKHVHHMLVFICDDIPPQYLTTKSFACGPMDGSFVMALCRNLIGAWASGIPPISFQPPDVGLPFTPEMSGKKIVIQMHYDNSDHSKFIDDSGMNFMLTNKLRKLDEGIMMGGILDYNIILTMPPGQEKFRVQGHCSEECTRRTIPPEGITIFSAGVHMHTRGKNAVARHFRGDEEILPPLTMDMYYNFNFQSFHPLLSPRKFLPGDRIVVQCDFTTRNETQPIFGGEGTKEEMCMIFLAYYPKVPLNICGSRYKLPDYLEVIGVSPMRKLASGGGMKKMGAVKNQKSYMEQQKVMQKLMKTMTEPVRNFISSENWTSEKVETFEKFYASNKYNAICITQAGASVVPDDDLPIIPPFTPPDDNC